MLDVVGTNHYSLLKYIGSKVIRPVMESNVHEYNWKGKKFMKIPFKHFIFNRIYLDLFNSIILLYN